MTLYKNILIGINTLYPDWLNSIKQLNKSNIIIFDFKDSDKCKNIIVNKNIDYILPLSEKDYLLIKKIIVDDEKILYPNVETFNILNNKLFFINFILKYFNEYVISSVGTHDTTSRVKIPTIYYLDNIKVLDIIYPVISKPVYSTNGTNMKIYYNHSEFIKCKNKMIIQKFIEDQYEYSAYILCINGKIINWKIIKFRYEKYTIKKDNFPKNYENVKNIKIKLFEPIILKLNYTGGMCIDFKLESKTNNIYIFEMNPRFGGSAFTNNFIYELLCINMEDAK